MQCSSEFRREENREVVRDVGNAVAVVVDGAEPDGRHLAVEDVVDVPRKARSAFAEVVVAVNVVGFAVGRRFARRPHEFEEAVEAGAAAVARGVGGAYKPRTSPYAFQGMQFEGLKLLKEAKEVAGLPIVSEIMSASHIDMFNQYVDVFQVGARNMQNFEMLKELGKVDKPILLKRGLANTLEELLMSAEYIMSGGNENVILCERGVRTFETYTRNTLDISAIPALKKMTHLPVVIDPSHACGMSWMVEPLAKAAVAAGADGLIIEVHNNPKKALCDGQQSLTIEQYEHLVNKIKKIADIEERSI